MNIALFALLALIAEILGTVGGFGSSVFFVPLAGFFFDLKTVLGITAIFHVFSNASKLILFYKTINWKLALQFGIPSVAMVIAGAWLTTKVSLKYGELGLGIFLLCFSAFLLWKDKLQLPQSFTTSTVGGGLAGFLAGFLGTGGAVRGLAMSAYNLEKNLFVGTSAAIDMGVDLSRAIIYTESGYVSNNNYYLIAILFVVSMLGSYTGKQLLQKISQERFRNLVLLLIGAVGGAMLLKGIYEFKA